MCCCTSQHCSAPAQVQAVLPHCTDNLLLMGAIYYHLRDFQQSVQCNDLCILIDPTVAEAHANLANSLQQLGHLSMAALYYQVRLVWAVLSAPAPLKLLLHLRATWAIWLLAMVRAAMLTPSPA
jgi:tetratricopeptide (TPR) repeat protein